MISIRISNSQNTQFITVYPMEDLTIPLPAISETLQHQELSCTFKLPYDADEFAYIMAYEELNAVVFDNQTPVFTGIIKNEATWQDNGYPLPMDSISLTISDNTYLFNKKTDAEIAKINQKLDAVVQYICQNCGATIAQNQVLRQTVIQAFVLDSGKSYLEAFNNLLFQYGYAFYFNGSGEVQFVDLLAEPQQRLQLTESDLFTGLEIRKTTRNYSGVRLTYNELEKKENEQVYFEGNGVNEDSQVTPITVRPNQYYPYDSDPTQEAREGQVFQTFEDGYAESYTLYSGEQKFRRSSKTTLVYTENHRLVEDWEGSITVNRTQYGARQASVRLLNTGTTDASLYQLAIRADAYYRSQDVFLNYGDSTNPYEYQSEYIYDATSAQAFASMLTKFLMGGNFKVTAKLSVGIDVGTHVSIDTGLSGFTCNAIVLACEYDAKNQIYKCTFHSYGTASTIASRYKKYASNYGKFSEQQISVKSILSITEEYYLSTSPTVVQGGQWLPDAPEWVQGKYIWTRTKITYNSGEVTVTDPLRTTAIENVGIGSVDVEYAQTDNAVTAPTTGWSTTAPAWQQGKYIWSRTKTSLSDGTELYSNPACITGQRGETGDSIQYLGPLSALPENPKNGDFFLCVSEFSETSRLKLVNGNLLTLTDGNYLLITRGYTPKYIYAYSDGWWRVDDYNDYRYILASNDLLERGWDLSTNLQDALDTLDSDAQGYADAAQSNATHAAQGYASAAQDNAKNYTDGEIQTVNNSISTLSQSVNQSISNINTSLGNKIEYVPRYLGKSATAPSGAKKDDWFLNTTAKVLQKYNGTTWDNVDQYTAENAYMYNAAVKDCLELAETTGNVALFAAAFIAHIYARYITLENPSVLYEEYGITTEGYEIQESDDFMMNNVGQVFGFSLAHYLTRVNDQDKPLGSLVISQLTSNESNTNISYANHHVSQYKEYDPQLGFRKPTSSAALISSGIEAYVEYPFSGRLWSLLTDQSNKGVRLTSNKRLIVQENDKSIASQYVGLVSMSRPSYINGSATAKRFSDGSFEITGHLLVEGTLAINFQTEFGFTPTIIDSVQVSPYNQPTSHPTDTNYICMPINISTAGFTIRYKDSDGTSDRTGHCSFTVKGWWSSVIWT